MTQYDDDPRERNSMTPGRQRLPKVMGAILESVADRAERAGAAADGLRRIADQLAPPARAPLSPDEAEALTGALADANGFLLEALPDNRAGRLSEAQRAARVRSLRGARPTAVVVALGLMIVMAGALVFIAPSELRALRAWRDLDTAARHLGTLVAIAGGWVAALWALAIAFGADGSRRELREGQVATIEGVVTGQPTPKTQTGWYLVGDRSFKVNAAGFAALVAGLPYRCYYLPRTGTLVNIEALSTGG